MNTERDFEKRLDSLRAEAATGGILGKGVDIAGGPVPLKPGYYGQPVVKPPVWTWEVPAYFFVGGLAGMAAVIALAAVLFHQLELARDAMWFATLGVVLSPVLLVLDLGRPRLFLNMLRVFKYRSPMSVGAWILSFFGACVLPGFVALELHSHHILGSGLDPFVRVAAGIFIAGSAFFGTLLATYTGVLIGATAIPAWSLHRILLPIHFGTAGLGSAAAALELLGHQVAPLNAIGFLAAGIESALWLWLEVNKHGAADRALHVGGTGWMIRTAEFLTGPFSLFLRFFGLVPLAAISFPVGALISRFGWIAAGRDCGKDPEAVFASQKL